MSDDEPFNNASSTSNIGVINSTVESEVGRVFGRQSSTTSKVDTNNTKSNSSAAVAPSTLLYNSRKYFGNPRSAMKSVKSKRRKESASPFRPRLAPSLARMCFDRVYPVYYENGFELETKNEQDL